MKKILNIAVDFDGTLTIDNGKFLTEYGVRVPGDPNWAVIKQIQKLHSMGHKIMIYSLRCNPDPESLKFDALAAIRGSMIDFLKLHSISYDSIYNGKGKPHADYFIDDRNICLDNLEDFVDRLLTRGKQKSNDKIQLNDLERFINNNEH